MIEDSFPGEGKIKSIGGKLYEDYLSFKKDVFYINIYYFELFSRLGMTDDVSCIIEALQSHKVANVYRQKIWRDINEGRIPREKFMSMPIIKYAREHAFSDPDNVRKREEKSINCNISYRYKEFGERYLKDNKIYPFDPKHNHRILEICGGALCIAPTQLVIDVNKFIDVYGNYLEASESKSGKLHQQVADTINQFFNGIEITPRELERYFVLKDGVIKVNPNSQKRENYLRLGWRCCK